MTTDQDMQVQILQKLAKLEANQEHHGDQLLKVLELLDRMVKVEEHQASASLKIIELENDLHVERKRVDELLQESNHWRTVRRVTTWLVGIGIAIAGLFHFGGNHG